MKTKTFFLALLFLYGKMYAQAPSIDFKKCYGGTLADNSNDIFITSDGGSVMVGTTNSNNGDVPLNKGAYDGYIVKLDAQNNIVWKKTYGGSLTDKFNSVYQTSDGGYIVLGTTNSNNGDVSGNHSSLSDIWVLKLNTTGNIVWKKCFGGTLEEYSAEIRQTNDGGYIVLGSTRSNNGDVSGLKGQEDYWLFKLNSQGTIMWSKLYGGPLEDYARSFFPTSDGGYIISGETQSTSGDIVGYHGGVYDAWVVKVNSQGGIEWKKCFGGDKVDYLTSIIQTNDGGYIMSGGTESTTGDLVGVTKQGQTDFWFIKTNSLGNITWQKCYGSPNHDNALNVRQTPDNGFIAIGTASGNGGNVSLFKGNEDMWVIKLSSLGGLVWQKTLGGTARDHGMQVCLLQSGGYLCLGSTESTNGDVVGNHGNFDFWLVKLSGSSGSGGTCSNTNEPNETLAAAKVISPNVDVTGQIASNIDKDYLKFTTTAAGNVTVALTTLPADYELKLYNSAGTQIGSSTNGGTTSENIVMTNLAAGTYTAYIYGYNGAFSTSNCYTLKVTTTSGGGGGTCSNTNEPNETLSAAKVISTGVDVKGQIASSTDKDYLKFTTTASGNVTVALTTLPADYDVKLYNSSGVEIGSSQQSGTTSETISKTGLAAGTYTVYIYGYSGANSNTLCYNLKVTVSGSGGNRIAQEDGSVESAQEAMIAKPQSLQVYPNPNDGSFSLDVMHNQTEEVSLQVMDITGKVIHTQKVSLQEGSTQKQISLDQVAPGMYILHMQGENWTDQKQIVVQ